MSSVPTIPKQATLDALRRELAWTTGDLRIAQANHEAARRHYFDTINDLEDAERAHKEAQKALTSYDATPGMILP